MLQGQGRLVIKSGGAVVLETRDLDENTLLDSDANGQICAVTIEQASEGGEIAKFSYD